MQSKKRNKFLSVLIVLTLVLGSSITGFGASPFSDTSGHWAESSIQEAASMGFIKGYANGTFKPDNPVTRAEFSRMLNVVLGLTNQVSTGFQDVNSTEWYYGEVRKAVSAGFISGYADNTFRPNSKITRQEAAVMISRVLPPAVSAPSLAGFDDSSSIYRRLYEGGQPEQVSSPGPLDPCRSSNDPGEVRQRAKHHHCRYNSNFLNNSQ